MKPEFDWYLTNKKLFDLNRRKNVQNSRKITVWVLCWSWKSKTLRMIIFLLLSLYSPVNRSSYLLLALLLLLPKQSVPFMWRFLGIGRPSYSTDLQAERVKRRCFNKTDCIEECCKMKWYYWMRRCKIFFRPKGRTIRFRSILTDF